MAERKLDRLGLIVMGPCACGKSEVGNCLAKHFNCPFFDADSFHPEKNIVKMQNGIPLTDEDRIPWLQRVRNEMINNCKLNHEPVGIVAACSALKKSYRDILHGENQISKNDNGDQSDLKIVFVFLNCSRKVLEQRLTQRTGHFMKLGMLESQLNTLELPDAHESLYFVTVNGDLELQDLLLETYQKLDKLTVK